MTLATGRSGMQLHVWLEKSWPMQHGNAKRPGTQQSARKERQPLPSLTGALSRAMVAALTAAGALARWRSQYSARRRSTKSREGLGSEGGAMLAQGAPPGGGNMPVGGFTPAKSGSARETTDLEFRRRRNSHKTVNTPTGRRVQDNRKGVYSGSQGRVSSRTY